MLTLVLLGWLSLISTGHAADLSGPELAHLAREFGVCADGTLLGQMSPQERATLHDMFVEPWTRDYPDSRDARLASALGGIYQRQCHDWAQGNRSPVCPPAKNPANQPGKNIADDQCNACHLFGTADAPAFFRLGRDGGVTPQRLSDTLASGHRMSPIHISDGQAKDLANYIESLVCR